MIVDITHANSAENNHETSTGNTKTNPMSVIQPGWAEITRDLGIVQTLATIAGESDIAVTGDVFNEYIHHRLFEPASCTCPAADSSETFGYPELQRWSEHGHIPTHPSVSPSEGTDE